MNGHSDRFYHIKYLPKFFGLVNPPLFTKNERGTKVELTDAGDLYIRPSLMLKSFTTLEK